MLYTGKQLREISFPLGGIGTGSIGLAGNGHLVDWEIFNKPDKGSLNGHTGFFVRAEYPDGRAVCKVLQGDWTQDLSGTYSKAPSGHYYGFGFGPEAGTLAGFPHFESVTFDGAFPIARLTFEDAAFPGRVVMTAFNPFIPLNADDSSIPAAFFDVSIEGAPAGVRCTVLLTVTNPFAQTVNVPVEGKPFTAVSLRSAEGEGDLTAAVDAEDGFRQTYWYRGAWKDGISTFWYDLENGCLAERLYDEPARCDTCAVGASAVAQSGANCHFRFALGWNVPVCRHYWRSDREWDEVPTWKNFYTTLFADSAETCAYALAHWDRLFAQTDAFRQSLHQSTLDEAVIDAASSTLSVLKSPTVLRLEDGTFYGWEGVHEQGGSCEGTCTHVWSYAYALCFLFPDLERGLRETELLYDTDEHGGMRFRTKLPRAARSVRNEEEKGKWFACLDGQMATVIKIYRDWKITGNSAWLREHWDETKRVLEYAWSEHNPHEWDRDHDGVLEGRQHHTLDMELFGPSSWLESMYLTALRAAAEMAAFLNDAEKQAEYTRLFENGYAWMRDHLFNGEYFIQQVNLGDASPTEHFGCPNYWNTEKKELKYQIGEGSAIDQMLGQWHARVCGLGDVFDPAQCKTALESMMKYNFRSMRNHANTWRVYALNDEAGSIMCAYPQGSRMPVISVPYTGECMTGFEYAFAGLLVSEGKIEDGLRVVRAIRSRYDGEKRNPWNEIECGSNYARPMASFALLPLFSGMEYDLPRRHIGFAPLLPGDFRCLWSLGTGWGDYIRREDGCTIALRAGALELESVGLEGGRTVTRVMADGQDVAFAQDGSRITFETLQITKELNIQWK